jgi:hypothetical protein
VDGQGPGEGLDRGEQPLLQALNLVEAARKEGLDAEHAIATALEAILVSPDFLFRVERDPPGAAGQVRRVTDVEMASRLSYFLWSSMPDDELLALAEAGKLSAPQTLEARVKRMLADPTAGDRGHPRHGRRGGRGGALARPLIRTGRP